MFISFNTWLIVAAGLSAIAALLHIAIGFGYGVAHLLGLMQVWSRL